MPAGDSASTGHHLPVDTLCRHMQTCTTDTWRACFCTHPFACTACGDGASSHMCNSRCLNKTKTLFSERSAPFTRRRKHPTPVLVMPTSGFMMKEHVSPSCAQVEWNNPADPTKGFKYIYLSDADYSSIAARADNAVLKAEPFFADNGAVLNPARDCNLDSHYHYMPCLSEHVGPQELGVAWAKPIWHIRFDTGCGTDKQGQLRGVTNGTQRCSARLDYCVTN